MSIIINTTGNASMPNRNFTSLISAHASLKGWWQPTTGQVDTPLTTLNPRAGSGDLVAATNEEIPVVSGKIPIGGVAFGMSTFDDVAEAFSSRTNTDTHTSYVFGFKHNPDAAAGNDDDASPFDAVAQSNGFGRLRTFGRADGRIACKDPNVGNSIFSDYPAASLLTTWGGWSYGIITTNATGLRVSAAGGAVSSEHVGHFLPTSDEIGWRLSPTNSGGDDWDGWLSDVMVFSGGIEADLHEASNLAFRATLHSYFRTIFGERF